MNKVRVSTMITDINKFMPSVFQKNNIGIEIQTFPQHILDDNYEDLIEKFQKVLKNFRGIVSLHGSAFDLKPGSTDKRILEVTKYRYLQSIEIARKLGASYVVFHSQVNPLLKVSKIKQMKLDNQVKFWIELLNEIKDNKITILLENEYDDNYIDLLYLVEKINSDKVKICFDIGHALAYSDLNLEQWIKGLGSHIKYIHLHWNDRQRDSHDVPSDESLELLNRILVENRINPIITLEYRVDDIINESNKLREIFA